VTTNQNFLTSLFTALSLVQLIIKEVQSAFNTRDIQNAKLRSVVREKQEQLTYLENQTREHACDLAKYCSSISLNAAKAGEIQKNCDMFQEKFLIPFQSRRAQIADDLKLVETLLEQYDIEAQHMEIMINDLESQIREADTDCNDQILKEMKLAEEIKACMQSLECLRNDIKVKALMKFINYSIFCCLLGSHNLPHQISSRIKYGPRQA